MGWVVLQPKPNMFLETINQPKTIVLVILLGLQTTSIEFV
jgi:hypothetical protein